MPRRPAMRIVSSCEHATHSGGCGFWRGLGMTLRSGKSKYSPWYSQRVVPEHRHAGSARRPPTPSRLSRKRRSNGCSSVTRGRLAEPELDAPVLTAGRASTPARRRAPGGSSVSWMMPWPRRMFFVRWLAAAEEHLGRASCASTPRGSGARPPTRSRSRAGRPARSGRGCAGAARTRRRRSTAAAAGARRRSRTSRGVLPVHSSGVLWRPGDGARMLLMRRVYSSRSERRRRDGAPCEGG